MRRWMTVVVLLLAVPSPAAAEVGLSNVIAHPIAAGKPCRNVSAPPVDAPAGAHRDFCLSFSMDGGGDVFGGGGGDDVKDMDIALPAGVVGDPNATPRCPQATFAAAGCANPATRVGSALADVSTLPFPLADIAGDVYNLTPAGNEPARLGIQLNALGLIPVRLESPIRVRTTDAGLTSTVRGIARTLVGDLEITRMSLRLWGDQADHPSLAKPFISLPTRCDAPATTTVTIRSYAGVERSASAGFTPRDCDRVPYTPGLEIDPLEVPADRPGESSATLVLPDGDTVGPDGIARRQAYIRRVALQLPEGVALNPPLAQGLEPCTEEQFGAGRDAPPACPASSEIGRVRFETPLLAEPLTGKVYFGVPRPGQRLRNFVSVEDPRLRLKLIGDVTVDQRTGAILNVFEDAPQVPFTRFTFTYNGGPHATLTSPPTCGPRIARAPLTPWTGQPTVTPEATFTTVDCAPPAFTPSLAADVSDARAGAGTALSVRVTRPDRQLRLGGMSVSLPPGLTGRLGAVAMCPAADAREGRCPPAARVGSVALTVGTGEAPLPLSGDVFLTSGFDGALAGLAMVVSARVPALDLGTVAVLARLALRDDGGIDVVTEGLPQAVEGIPVAYRSIELRIDREGFLQNATSCAAQAVRGTITAVDGTAVAAEAPYAATGCAELPFGPRMRASLGAPGEVAKGAHPPLAVTVEQDDGAAALRRAAVTLPAGLGIDLANLTTLCSDEQFAARACPPASRLGSVEADTALLPFPLSGPVHLLRPAAGATLPGMGVDLGLLRMRAGVALTADGRIQTIFEGLPDVPLRRLTLTVDGGRRGALRLSRDLCGRESHLAGAFTSHAGGSAP
ncbi:MAG: hypothetical protein HZB46_13905, partial [Solirubrobacterales bacterium]|nr:hypothetical protein [Solirubrobacterales bacterium]